ncbi:hypothetical protein J132_02735 [Termitomyces sp. J132]|nr:hypothetical protein J132_02735 [Termitomyces sp. J132]
MMLINNKEEVECIHDSGSQIISMSAEIASDLGLSYDPNIVLNMQSANSTMDQSLGLVCNIPCTIGDITIYLQIHVLWFPTYNIFLRCPFDVAKTFASRLKHPVAFIAKGINKEGSNIAIIISYDYSADLVTCVASCNLDKDIILTDSNTQTNPVLSYLYATASNLSELSLPPHSYLVSTDTSNFLILRQTLPLDTNDPDITPTYVNIPFPTQFVANESPKQKGVQVKKKYEPITIKTKPVASHISEDF